MSGYSMLSENEDGLEGSLVNGILNGIMSMCEWNFDIIVLLYYEESLRVKDRIKFLIHYEIGCETHSTLLVCDSYLEKLIV